MKTEAQIKQKLKQVKYRARKRYLEEHLSRVPHNCTFNAAIEGVPAREKLPRVCTHTSQYGEYGRTVLVCDSRVTGCDRAPDCPWFETRRTKEQLKEDFKATVGPEANIGRIAAEHPDMAALIWVLGSHDSELDLGVQADAATERLIQLRTERPAKTGPVNKVEPEPVTGKVGVEDPEDPDLTIKPPSPKIDVTKPPEGNEDGGEAKAPTPPEAADA